MTASSLDIALFTISDQTPHEGQRNDGLCRHMPVLSDPEYGCCPAIQNIAVIRFGTPLMKYGPCCPKT